MSKGARFVPASGKHLGRGNQVIARLRAPFTQSNIWPASFSSTPLNGVVLPPNSLGNPALLGVFEILKYTPNGVSVPNVELASPGNIEKAARIVGRLRVDILPAPSEGVCQQVANYSVGLQRVQWDGNINAWNTLNMCDVSQACSPDWMYLETRALFMMFIAATYGCRDTASTFVVPINTTVGPGENLKLILNNHVGPGGVGVAAFVSGRLSITHLE
jgi:hypothetical protein